MILTAVEKTNENAERWTGRHNLADHHLHPGWPSASSSSSLSSPLSSLSSSSSSSFLQCFCHYHPRNIMTNIIIIICPGQVLREKNWTDKVTDEMKKFEKSIIKAMRVGFFIAHFSSGPWLWRFLPLIQSHEDVLVVGNYWHHHQVDPVHSLKPQIQYPKYQIFQSLRPSWLPGGWLGWTWRRKQAEVDLPRFIHRLFFS